MQDNRLVDYIQSQLRSGYSPDSIRTVLRQQGWGDYEIEEAFKAAQFVIPNPKHVLQKPATGRDMGIGEKIKKSLFNSDELFENVRAEPLSKPFVYFAITNIVPTVVILVLTLAFVSIFTSLFASLIPMPPEFSGILTMFLILGPIFAAVIYALTLIGTFINAGITHIFAKIFSAKGSYSDTYKAFIYSTTPMTILFFLPIINIIWSIYLELKGLSILHRISMGRAALILFTPIIVVVAASFVILSAFSVGLYNPTNNGFAQDGRVTGLLGFSSPSNSWELTETDFTITLVNDMPNSVNITDTDIIYMGTENTVAFVNGAAVGNGHGVVVPPNSAATFVYNINGPESNTPYSLQITVYYAGLQNNIEMFTSGSVMGTSI